MKRIPIYKLPIQWAKYHRWIRDYPKLHWLVHHFFCPVFDVSNSEYNESSPTKSGDGHNCPPGYVWDDTLQKCVLINVNIGGGGGSATPTGFVHISVVDTAQHEANSGWCLPNDNEDTVLAMVQDVSPRQAWRFMGGGPGGDSLVATTLCPLKKLTYAQLVYAVSKICKVVCVRLSCAALTADYTNNLAAWMAEVKNLHDNFNFNMISLDLWNGFARKVNNGQERDPTGICKSLLLAVKAYFPRIDINTVGKYYSMDYTGLVEQTTVFQGVDTIIQPTYEQARDDGIPIPLGLTDGPGGIEALGDKTGDEQKTILATITAGQEKTAPYLYTIIFASVPGVNYDARNIHLTDGTTLYDAIKGFLIE